MPSAENGRHTRAQILRTAMDTASVKGLSGLSIGDLATRLGMSKSGLFRHFGAKEQLQLATADAALDVFEQEVVTPAMAAAPGVDRLRALMHHWVGYLERDVFPGGCFFAAASADVDSQPGPVRDRIAGIGRAAIDAIAAEVEAAQRLGQLRADIDRQAARVRAACLRTRGQLGPAAAGRRRCRRPGPHRDRCGARRAAAPPKEGDES